MKDIPSTIKLTLIFMLLSIVAKVLISYLLGNYTEATLLLDTKTLLIPVLFFLFLGYNISLRQNWARILLLVAFSMDLLWFIFELYQFNDIDMQFHGDLRILSLAILKQIFQVSAALLLFTKTSSKWFNMNENLNSTASI